VTVCAIELIRCFDDGGCLWRLADDPIDWSTMVVLPRVRYGYAFPPDGPHGGVIHEVDGGTFEESEDGYRLVDLVGMRPNGECPDCRDELERSTPSLPAP
jgi:hypothetical protein